MVFNSYVLYIILTVSPRVIKLENIIRVRQNETAVLRIDVLSNPPPIFSWYKLTDTDEWTPVELFKHIVVLNERLHSNLIIPGAGPHNEGIYKVVASNGYGIPFIQEYEVILEGKPYLPHEINTEHKILTSKL